jgi:toxin ParE1/3/4
MSQPRCRILFVQSARDDLRDVLGRHVSQDVPQVGTHTMPEIIDRVRQPATFPDGGRVVPELETPWPHELVHSPFRIVCRRDEDQVTVVRVWRNERLMDPALAGSA